MPVSVLAGASAPALVCFGGLFALLLRRAWRVHVVAATHRKRHRAWLELTSTWHTPLLLLGLAIAAARLAFLVAIHVRADWHPLVRRPGDSTTQRRWLWFWLELPSALISILAAYLLFFASHVALFRVWPVRFGSMARCSRLLFVVFTSLLVGAVALVAHERESSKSSMNPRKWMCLSLKYFAVIWIVSGATLLKFQGLAAEVMWRERDAGRLVVLTPRSLHAVIISLTTFSLVLILRGATFAMLAFTTSDMDSDPLIPNELFNTKTTVFLAMYGVWEIFSIGAVYHLCTCVPVSSRVQGHIGEVAIGEPIVTGQSILHFSLPSPKNAVEGYLKSATAVVESRARMANRRFEDTSPYDPTDDLRGNDRIDNEDFHEPLLGGHNEDE